MKIKETRRMSMDSLRNLCIRNDWFTRGDCRAYDKFLKMSGNCQKNITTNALYNMALNVEQYSDPSVLDGQDTAAIMYDLARICYNTFEVEED